ncbi:MAG: hypothetical protein SVR94_20020, partial [Pseudomonadota bacterium]|nr:hypothetical protein [Pseudomonadota bacterium]
MVFAYSNSEDIESINSMIKNESYDEAVDAFGKYIENVINDVKTYSEWSDKTINSCYDFGKVFQDVNPSKYIDLLNNKIESIGKDEAEFLHFLKSEIEVNFYSAEDCFGHLNWCLENYPSNPEFVNNK